MNKAFLIIFMLGVCYCFTSYGQQSSQNPIMIEVDTARLNKKMTKLRQAQTPNPQRMDVFKKFQLTHLPANDTARYSHTTPKGHVYTLPQDNMPMLKPIVDSMAFFNRLTLPPGTKITQGRPIPNPIPTNPIYFEKPPTLQLQKSTDNTKK